MLCILNVLNYKLLLIGPGRFLLKKSNPNYLGLAMSYYIVNYEKTTSVKSLNCWVVG